MGRSGSMRRCAWFIGSALDGPQWFHEKVCMVYLQCTKYTEQWPVRLLHKCRRKRVAGVMGRVAARADYVERGWGGGGASKTNLSFAVPFVHVYYQGGGIACHHYVLH